jgi:energy-coupling factor transport system permease protein
VAATPPTTERAGTAVTRALNNPRLPRLLHPAAWWAWAIGLAMAASRTTNPLLLALVMAVAAYVVSARRELGAACPFGAFLRLGLFVIAMRVLFEALLGGGVPGATVLVNLPQIPLPIGWGVRLGGPVTLEGVLAAAYDGARLAAVLACIGAANALASPRRLLRYVPATLYEVGTALVVALTYAPQLVDDAGRVRAARRLRGHSGHSPRELSRLAVPVLDGALEHSLDLAASMESRGYGRSVHRDAGSRRKATALTLLGLGGVVAGVYGLLDGGSAPLLGLPLLLAGSAAAGASLAVGARRERRSRYRPDPWAAPEWVVSFSGAIAGAAVLVAAQRGVGGIILQTSPAVWPILPLVPALGVLLALAPAWLSPQPPLRAAEHASSPAQDRKRDIRAGQITPHEIAQSQHRERP